MDAAEFEQNILQLAFETDVEITTASVAYYLGIPSRKAQTMLEELLEQGVLELDSDPEGNLYYRVADVAGGQAERIAELKGDRMAGLDGRAQPGEAAERSDREGADPQPRWPGGDHAVTSVDDSGEAEAISPVRAEATASAEQARTARDGASGQPPAAAEEKPAGGAGSRRTRRQNEAPSTPGSSAQTHSDGRLADVTRRRGAPDARVDSCGGPNSVVVGPEARCEPRPLADSHPTFASCADESRERRSRRVATEEQRQQGPQLNWAQAQDSRQQALATTAGSSAAVYGDEQLERPEHQPGMSLLLSLILCGTGQIYNGEVSKGIMMMVLCFLLWFVLLGWVVHIWSIVDSVVVAERINRNNSSG